MMHWGHDIMQSGLLGDLSIDCMLCYTNTMNDSTHDACQKVSNGCLSGFVEADGHFYGIMGLTKNEEKNKHKKHQGMHACSE